MTLDQYLTEAKITEAEFGRQVGLSQSQINRIRLGASYPSWEKIPAITKATKGRVRAADFVRSSQKGKETAA